MQQPTDNEAPRLRRALARTMASLAAVWLAALPACAENTRSGARDPSYNDCDARTATASNCRQPEFVHSAGGEAARVDERNGSTKPKEMRMRTSEAISPAIRSAPPPAPRPAPRPPMPRPR